jgi:hypothetical protein
MLRYFLMSQNQNFEPTPLGLEARALQLGAETFDLRNQLLYDRIGTEGMQALADHKAEKSFFADLEAEIPTTPEGLALSTLFEEQERNELSRDIFQGRSFDELDSLERHRLEQSQEALHEHRAAVEATHTGILSTAAQEQAQLDNELNRVFNDTYTGFKYDGSRQTADKVTIHTDMNSASATRMGPIAFVQEVNLEKDTDGNPKGALVVVPLDITTGYPVDLLKLAEGGGHDISEEDLQEYREWSKGVPLEPEVVELLKDGLEKVKTYLEHHLDPDTKAPRQGKYGPE